ncbi:MAG: CpaD family pilus assembly protein [Erythrobacter sp.]|jgi:pilus assembly protein CpaD|uniref:CpaD family pilus assembly protein n=1 Tax=Erythrobacter sp. TaxID=1042 RepID=UPI002B46BA6E|nr:CpaD family pilus assembly protein [Erythrobacter sp.]WRH70291.1 MAG: CpaD family pilus assembly protein [Erythrobacter sp.]
MPVARPNTLTGRLGRAPGLALALTLGLGLAGCGGMPTNTTLYSVKQPVVERTNFTLDVNTSPSGLPISELQRLNGWFETMDLRYGDRIAIENPGQNPAVTGAIRELAGRYGLMISDAAPATAGMIGPGQARVVITRSNASVPGCPDWSANSDMNYTNGTSPNFGCAVNSNMAAMVADPQDLLEGKQGSGETVLATSNKAIKTFREAAPTGAAGLLDATAGGGGGGGGTGGGN